MKGTIYGIGVGPGDPELMTLKACRLIEESDVIAVPGKVPEESAAYRIAAAAVPALSQKVCLGVDMPMVRDKETRSAAHHAAARRLEEILDAGKNIAYLTLGDVTLYCTFSYLQHLLEADGYAVRLVSGITSVSAAAARLNRPLAEWNEELHIIPGAHTMKETLTEKGTCVIMKSGSRMKEIKALLEESGKDVCAVENCGMEGEKVYESCAQIPDNAGYFSLIIAKDPVHEEEAARPQTAEMCV